MLERQIFLIVLWVSAAVAAVAHASDGATNIGFGLAAIGALAIWVHLVCRCHQWTAADHGTTRYLVTTLGIYSLLGTLLFVDVAYLFMLFGVFSFTFGYSSRVKQAALLSALLTAMWIAGWLYYDLPTGAVVTPVFVWLIANAINALSTRISNQNIERGELIERLTETREELAEAERERGVLEERSRLAREIHDTLAQGFTSVVLLAEATSDQLDSLKSERISHSLSLIASTARDNLDEARRLVDKEQPSVLNDRSLDAALLASAQSLAERTGISVTTELPSQMSIGGNEEVVLLRIAQEACSNVEKHAQASNVFIGVELGKELVVLTVEDDGIGLGAASANADLSGGSGLGFMKERASELDGSVEASETSGGGTTITASIPIAGVSR